jgi:hypothetical protein
VADGAYRFVTHRSSQPATLRLQKGRGAQAPAHLARVNGWTLGQTEAYIDEAFGVWAQRSHGPWMLDLEGLRPYVLGGEYLRIVRQAAIPPERRQATGL